jgi:putative endonuclease
MFIQDFSNPKDAITVEKQIKGWSRKKKEALFLNNWNKIHELAKCKNSSSHDNHKRPPFDSAQGDKI